MERTIGSRFLEELPENHVKTTDHTQSSDRASNSLSDYGEGYSYESEPDDSDDLGGLTEGMMVRHPRFGVGKVDAILSKGPQPRVRIAFTQAGLKTIVLGYAPLVPLE